MKLVRWFFVLCSLASLGLASAQPVLPQEPSWALNGQFTWIQQHKNAFSAPYTGPQSLQTQAEASFSRTVTAALGLRLWPGAQLQVQPEGASGRPLSGLTGAAGLSNGELQRGASPELRGYLARAYVLQRVRAGGEAERIDADFGELGEVSSQRRWTWVAGTFSMLDFFDPNPYAKDAREQFTNWSFLTHGAWDYPADARGYTRGAMVEFRAPEGAFRLGRGAQPQVSNGLALDDRLNRQWGDVVELEAALPWQAPGGALRARALWFHNRIDAGAFADALAWGQAQGATPDVAQVRRLQDKRGWGFTLEAPLGPDAGLFLRASGADGRTESYAFTQIDRQVAVGGQFSAARWGRPRDRWGLGLAVNNISQAQRDYLAAGGLGVFLGDGRLRAAPERVLETWYRWDLRERDLPRGARLKTALSAGWQLQENPGYNAERRGPVQVWMLRLHSEF